MEVSEGLGGTQSTCAATGLPSGSRGAAHRALLGSFRGSFAEGKAWTCEEAHEESLP